MSTWVYLNLDTEAHDFKFWMAHELGHVYSPDLRGNEAEDFADFFAGALLFPKELAEQAYNDISSKRSNKMKISTIKEYALHYSISLISVYMEINKFASHTGKPIIDLGNSLFGANTNFNKNFMTGSSGSITRLTRSSSSNSSSLDNLSSLSGRGYFAPLSHLETASLVTFNFLASAVWLKPASSMADLMFVVLSIFSISEQYSHISVIFCQLIIWVQDQLFQPLHRYPDNTRLNSLLRAR